MQRRHFVAILVPLTAGCSQLPFDEESESATETPPPEETPTPTEELNDETETPTEEEAPPTPAVERVDLLYRFERLRGFDVALTPDGDVLHGSRIVALAEISLPETLDEATGTLEIRYGDEQQATHEFTVTRDDDDLPHRLDPLDLDTQPLDRGTLEAVVTARDPNADGDAEDDEGAATETRATAELVRTGGGSFRRARRHIDTARNYISDGVALFHARADGTALTDATAESTDIDLDGVISYGLDARGAVRDARSVDGPDIDDLVEQVEAEGNLLRRLVRSQRTAFEAVTRSRRTYAALGERSDNVSSPRSAFRDRVTELRDRLTGDDSVTNAWETASEGTPVVDYGPKVDQFHNELETFETWLDEASRCQDALATLREGESAMDNGRRDRAEQRADEAIETFDSILETLADGDHLPDTRTHHIEQVELLKDDAEFLRRRATR